MKHIATVLAVLTAGPAAAHLADVPHVHAEQVGALVVGGALIVVAAIAVAVRARSGSRRK